MVAGFSIQSVIVFLVIGLAAGWLASILLKNRRMGLLAYLLVGVVGALVGPFLFVLLGAGEVLQFGLIGHLFAAVIGAVILLLILRLFR